MQTISRVVTGWLSAAAVALVCSGHVYAQSAFWQAVEANNVSAVRAELSRGADPNSVIAERGPAIVFAARQKAFEVVRLLASLDKTQVDQPSSVDETALMLIALHGDRSTADLLIQRGAQVNRPGWTPLHYAATGGQVEMARWLLDEHHAFIDAQSSNGTTALMMASRMNHLRVVALLMEQGADPTLRNQAGLDATAYLERNGDPQSAAWMRERALRYIARYGTVEQPRWTQPNPAALEASGAAADTSSGLAPIPMKRDLLGAGDGASTAAGGANPSPAASSTGSRNAAAAPGAVKPATGSQSAPALPASPRPTMPSPAPATAKPPLPAPTPAAARPVAPTPSSPPASAAVSTARPPPAAPAPPISGIAPPATPPTQPVPSKAPQAAGPEPADAAPLSFSRTLSLPADPPPGPGGSASAPASKPQGAR